MNSDRFDLIVVGGGPAGSCAAAVAARRGLRVLLLEAAERPPPRRAENVLPGAVPVLEEMGAVDEVRRTGFLERTGATYWGWGGADPWDVEGGSGPRGWIVDRAPFDALLMSAAGRAGAEVQAGAPADALVWDRDRVVGVDWVARDGAKRRSLSACTLDATGQATTIARSLGLREPLPGLKHELTWACFDPGGSLPAPRERNALFLAAASWWAWHFPLSGGRASVGLVALDGGLPGGGDLEARFDRAVAGDERLASVIGARARRVTSVQAGVAWSYRASRVCGPGWLLAGDASGSLDPVVCGGLTFAMCSGALAGQLVAEAARGQLPEHDLHRRYERWHRRLFDGSLRAVKSLYEMNLGREDYLWESKRGLTGSSPAPSGTVTLPPELEGDGRS